MTMLIQYNCRYFRGDVPCRPHKTDGVHCEGCPYYSPVQERILIIKLDAMGDVLRTTCLLPGLKEKYPHSQITWITRAESAPLLEGIPFLDRVFPLEDSAHVTATDEFDIVINLDAAPLSARLATLARGKEKRGYGYHPRGYVYSLHPEAEQWFFMGLFDDVKKTNKETYQSLMLNICGLSPTDHSIQYSVKASEKDFAAHFAAMHSIGEKDLVVGLNTGAGARWDKKKWTENGYRELIGLIKNKYRHARILLYGGPGEIERNKRLFSENQDIVIDTGGSNTIRQFAALLDLSTLVVTGDTLALHLAAALRKKVIALVGPTSSAELDLYGKGIKITADLPCLCCYNATCGTTPDCMDSISPASVFAALEELLDR